MLNIQELAALSANPVGYVQSYNLNASSKDIVQVTPIMRINNGTLCIAKTQHNCFFPIFADARGTAHLPRRPQCGIIFPEQMVLDMIRRVGIVVHTVEQ